MTGQAYQQGDIMSFYTTAHEQGWDRDTMILVCLRYIEAQGLGGAFMEYSQQVAAEENEASAELHLT